MNFRVFVFDDDFVFREGHSDRSIFGTRGGRAKAHLPRAISLRRDAHGRSGDRSRQSGTGGVDEHADFEVDVTSGYWPIVGFWTGHLEFSLSFGVLLIFRGVSVSSGV